MKSSISSASFESALEKLNKSQRAAVEAIDGPVMVIAGPGTGKTQILTLRIANILLKTDTKPEQVLALTFTESGVRAMRQRLVQFIGAEAYHVPIHTFHSFAGDLIKRYPDAYDAIVGGRPASELEKIRIIENILEDTNFKRLRPHGDPAYYVKPVLQAIATLKKEYISADMFAQSISRQADVLADIPKIHEKGAHKGKVRGEYLDAEKSLEKNQELLAIYRQYSAALKADRLYDFEDMILDTIVALEANQEMLFDVQEQYHYILADEHQDVNQSQNRLIELIASYHEHPNVFVVGDEKQAIYRFQGASLDNFLYFSDVYKGAETIELIDNYRSDQAILDAAHETIKTTDPALMPLRVPLKAAQVFEKELAVGGFSHTALEEAYTVSEIQKELAKGTKATEIAVIVRTNREVELFTSHLRKAGVVVAPSADSDVLEHPLMRQISMLLRVAVDPTDEVALAELLHAPYIGLTTADIVTLLQARKHKQTLRMLISDPVLLSALPLQNPELVFGVSKLYTQSAQLAVTKSPAEVVEYLLTQSGLLDFVMAKEPISGAAVVRRLYDEIEGMCVRKEASSLKEVMAQFALLKEYGLTLEAPLLKTAAEAVQVMTAHKAKGLEFEVVVIPHLTDNVWGGSRGRAAAFDLPIRKHEVEDEKVLTEDDERRLLYVALTRAKRRLLCTYAAVGIDGREFTPSRFLATLESHLTPCVTAKFEHEFEPLSLIKPAPKTPLGAEFLRVALSERGWSATAFNNYKKSPWEFIYKNVLHIPNIKTPELQFGTAVHGVLERVVQVWVKTKALPEDSTIENWLAENLQKNVLSDSEYTRLHERGMKAVFGYLATLESSLSHGTDAWSEYSITATLPTGIEDFPEVVLTGNFDRLDIGTDGNVIRVVDYKTGKPKTRGEIEGTTKTSDGNYKRQLVFYALLLSLQTDERLVTKNTLLSFVEPDAKGVVHEEPFTITDEEITALKAEIITATKEVMSGECLLIACDPEKTTYCHLAAEWER